MAYEIDYNDKRFKEVETKKTEALTDLEKTYSDMITQSDKYYQDQIDASKQWEETQKKNQQELTDFAIEKIEQQKEQETKDYTREQSGAYVDWQKESNRYGANAERMASQGLINSGYAESSQVSMYNTYQNRVATAREAHNIAILNYNNGIKEARLQNNVKLAEIAAQAYQQQAELALAQFQYKNQLLLEKSNKKSEIEDRYHTYYQDVLNQINTENALAEEVRQFNETLAWQKAQASRSSSGGGGGGGSSSSSRSSSGGSTSSSKASGNALNTEYYSGSINKDGAKYGTFSNGYQPKGIRGYGTVSKSGKKIEVNTQTLSGKKQTLVQNVWETSDGSKWYWEGRENQYKKISQGGSGGKNTTVAAVK